MLSGTHGSEGGIIVYFFSQMLESLFAKKVNG